MTARGLVPCVHVLKISNECGELATLTVDWLCTIDPGSLKPGLLELGSSARACSYKGAERVVWISPALLKPGIWLARNLVRGMVY